MIGKPIIFSASMVRALLDGRKTQTRRIHHEQPTPEGVTATSGGGRTEWRYPNGNLLSIAETRINVGDRLYVRENLIDCTECGYRNHAEGANSAGAGDAKSCASCDAVLPKRMVPCIHMPRINSRITLTVTDVRVERLQEISEADAVAEGMGWEAFKSGEAKGNCPISSFRILWNTLHGPEAWDANPWVAAYSFTVQMGNIDRLGDEV